MHPALRADRVGLAPFRVHSAASGGPMPEEVREVLIATARAVAPLTGDEPVGHVACRFGHRVLVAPVAAPERAVDIVDIDLARGTVLTVGGADPGPAGMLLAQVLFLRTDAVVGYAVVGDVPGPTLPVLEKVMPALRRAGGVRVENVGVVAIGRRPEELRGALEALDRAPSRIS